MPWIVAIWIAWEHAEPSFLSVFVWFTLALGVSRCPEPQDEHRANNGTRIIGEFGWLLAMSRIPVLKRMRV